MFVEQSHSYMYDSKLSYLVVQTLRNSASISRIPSQHFSDKSRYGIANDLVLSPSNHQERGSYFDVTIDLFAASQFYFDKTCIPLGFCFGIGRVCGHPF